MKAPKIARVAHDTSARFWYKLKDSHLILDIIEYLMYEDYQKGREVSMFFFPLKTFRSLKLKKNVDHPTTLQLLNFFSSKKQYKHISLKTCQTVTDDVVQSILRSTIDTLSSLNLNLCLNIKVMPRFDTNTDIEVKENFHITLTHPSLSKYVFVSLEGNVLLYDAVVHDSILDAYAVLALCLTCAVHYPNKLQHFSFFDCSEYRNSFVAFINHIKRRNTEVQTYSSKFMIEGFEVFFCIKTNNDYRLTMVFIKIPYTFNEETLIGWKIFDITFSVY